MKELGIYGGTFSPPHKGHIQAILSFFAQIKPDETLIIPTAIPPHKAEVEGASPSDRLEMLRLALTDAGNSAIQVSDYEIRSEGKSYTCETLTHFASLYPKPEWRITFLCGTDMFLTLDGWYHPEIIFDKARIAFMRREKHSCELDSLIERKKELYAEKFGADIVEIVSDAVEISSCELREKLRAGIDTSEFLSPSVRRYIDEKRLYR